MRGHRTEEVPPSASKMRQLPRHIEVCWGGDNLCFPGTVINTALRSGGLRHLAAYDDGEESWESLKRQKWRPAKDECQEENYKEENYKDCRNGNGAKRRQAVSAGGDCARERQAAPAHGEGRLSVETMGNATHYVLIDSLRVDEVDPGPLMPEGSVVRCCHVECENFSHGAKSGGLLMLGLDNCPGPLLLWGAGLHEETLCGFVGEPWLGER